MCKEFMFSCNNKDSLRDNTDQYNNVTCFGKPTKLSHLIFQEIPISNIGI